MDLLAGNGTACHSSGSGSAGPTYVGFICAGVAVIFFGSNFVPVKKFETGDGKNAIRGSCPVFGYFSVFCM